MELVTRILDGSISYSPRGEPRGRSFFGGRISQDDKIDRLEDVGLLAGCSRRQLRAIARISEVIEVPAATVLARSGASGEDHRDRVQGPVRQQVNDRPDPDRECEDADAHRERRQATRSATRR